MSSSLRFAVNISTMYGEFDFLDRYDAAAQDGFTAVECQFPYAHSTSELRERLDANGLSHVLLNAPPGNWLAGERGYAASPHAIDDHRRSVATAIEYAEALDCSRIHVMAGNLAADVDREAALAAYVDNLIWACAQTDRTILIEPLNARDMPDYFLHTQDEAHRIVTTVGVPNLKVQLDLYHCELTEGDVSTRLRTDLPTGRVGHLQIAGVPDRDEPDRGVLDLDTIFSTICELEYDGPIGCEYFPSAGTREGLRWLTAYR